MDVYNVPHASAGPSHNDVEELASSEGQRPAKRSEKVSQVPIGGGLLIKKKMCSDSSGWLVSSDIYIYIIIHK